jgi:two-component system, chemotaxis family, protein-glutamate methylesterase/glutaminase
MKPAVEQVLELQAYRAFSIVVIAASAGGIPVLASFLWGLPKYFPAPIVVAQHLGPRSLYESRLDRVLQRYTQLEVKWANDGETLVPGKVYLAPQDKLTMIDAEDGTIRTMLRPDLLPATPTADDLFKSAAKFYGYRTLALVLSGALDDGAEGSSEVSCVGGRVLAQSCSSAEFADMPRAAMNLTRAALAVEPVALAHAAIALVMAPGASEWFRVGSDRYSGAGWQSTS